MNTLSKEIIPMQTPAYNGHCITLETVMTNAIEVEGLTARTILQLHERFAQHHEAAFAFAKMAGAAAEHEACLQRGWARLKMTPQAYSPIASQVGLRQQASIRTLRQIGETLLGDTPALSDAIQMCFQIIDEEEQAVETLIKAIRSPNVLAQTVINGMPCHKKQDYKAGFFYLSPDSVRMGGYRWGVQMSAASAQNTTGLA